MKKLLMLIIQFSFIVSLIFSYGAGWQHDEELHRVLFGTNDIWNESNELDTEKILKLDAACYLLLDYCKGQDSKGQACLDRLNLSKSVRLEDIVTPGGNTHEQYTHRGWDSKYYYLTKKQLQRFEFRRDKIMVVSVQHLFEDPSIDWHEAELLSQLCYYVHILGDHKGNSAYTSKCIMKLVQRVNEKKSDTILDELIRVCSALFIRQNSGPLINALKNLRDNSHTIDDSTENGKEQVRIIADKTVEYLVEYIPDLLKETDWFYSNFYIQNDIDMETAA